jgi:hypothetical protein
MTPRALLATGAALAAGLLATSGCTADPSPPRPSAPAPPVRPALQLVGFTTCDDALADIKRAAKEHIGPYGFGNDMIFAAGPNADAARAGGIAKPGSAAAREGAPAHSGTNTHEAGVDEPDLVKTDGRRIVTVSGGVLRVVDAGRRVVAGTLDLFPGLTDDDGKFRGAPTELLLHGDHALVLVTAGWATAEPAAAPDGPAGAAGGPAGTTPSSLPIDGPNLLLVDLTGAPRLLGGYRIDGTLLDARQVGATARLVVRSWPRLEFPQPTSATDAQRIAANRRRIDRAAIADWLPRYEVTRDGRTTAGRVGCDRLSRPETYSGTSMVTVLSFDLAAPALGDGDPVTLVADGETVYSNGPSLYVASDRRWLASRGPADRPSGAMPEQTTQIYKFDASRPGRPRYVAGGTVDGLPLNQYALSEWDGRLRVATTSGDWWPATGARAAQSTVYVLEQRGGLLAQQGKVSGLGKGERIYSVRFVGPIGYVVTFRQTDPLYTLDLRDPARPRVTGELKITGYSAYLHPAGDGRLIGVGQEATAQGRTQGTQVSLFDVSDLQRPRRLAQHHVRYAHSEAEYDPHAFLYWPADRLLVLPLAVYQPGPADKPTPDGGALVLRVGDDGLTEVGAVRHPAPSGRFGPARIQRSLVVDGVLWTLSDVGLQAVSLSTLDRLAWLAL